MAQYAGSADERHIGEIQKHVDDVKIIVADNANALIRSREDELLSQQQNLNEKTALLFTKQQVKVTPHWCGSLKRNKIFWFILILIILILIVIILLVATGVIKV